MKKLNYFLLGAAGLMLASCSQEEVVSPAAPGEGNFHITVSLPGNIQTRNTGLAAENLLIAVYDADNDNALVFEDNATFENSLQTNVGFNLAIGKTYNIALFATSETPTQAKTPASDTNKMPYTFDAENKQLVVNYQYMVDPSDNEEAEDCFYNVVSTGVVGTASSDINVTLYRPIAQINWGTSDLDEVSVKDNNAFGTDGQYIQTNLSTEAFNTLDLLTGDVTGDLVEVNLSNFNAPSGLAFPVQPSVYTYIAMQYVLAPKATSDIYNLTLNVDNGANPNANAIYNDVAVANAPVQANYQTNIYGALLTDNVNLTVIKSPDWAGSYLDPQDQGENVTGSNNNDLLYDEATKTYSINTPYGLYLYATNIANGSGQPLSGYTAILNCDVDMSKMQSAVTANDKPYTAWTPFNNGGATFDGQGHIISNLTVTTTGKTSAGFMSSAIGTVQNLNFSNAKISGNYKAGVLAGDGDCAKINNINVTGSTVTSTAWLTNGSYDDGNNAGGVVGYLAGEPTAYCTNCTVSDTYVTAYRTVGGVVGRATTDGGANSTATVANNTATNVTVTVNQNLNGGTYADAGKPMAIGEIVGELTTSASIAQNNTADNVNLIIINGEGQYVADNLDQLQAITDLTFDNQFVLQGKTIVFGTPNQVIDLDGATIEPIQIKFSGDAAATIDFNNVTLKNFTLNATSGNNALIAAWAGTIKNLNIEDMTIEGGVENSGVVGYLSGSMSDVTVSNSNISVIDQNAGVLAGNIYGASFTNCKVTNCNVTEGDSTKDGGGAGGFVGTISGDATSFPTFDNCSITGGTITGQNAGSVIGAVLSSSLTSNYDGITVDNVTVNGTATSEAGVTAPAN